MQSSYGTIGRKRLIILYKLSACTGQLLKPGAVKTLKEVSSRIPEYLRAQDEAAF
ncbi:hypothetical protein D3C87_1922540 [compost metagenome]